LCPDELFFPLQVGFQSFEDITPFLNSSLGVSFEPEEWSDLSCHIFTSEVPGMSEALADLRDAFRIVALSNTIEAHWEFLLERYPIFDLLDGWVVSYTEGTAKPDPAIYHAVTDRYCNGRLPIYYTDDIPQYVEAANSLGWEAGVFTNAANLKEEVEKRFCLS